MSASYKYLEITKYEHDTIHIKSTKTGKELIFDPFQSQGAFRAKTKADVIFISHDHFDHFSPKDINSANGKNTIYVFPASIYDKIQSFLDVPQENLLPVIPLDRYKIETNKGQISCMAVPAYNIDKKSSKGTLYHPKERNYVGFVVDIDGVSVYFAGDTDFIPEMEALTGMIDVLLIPISGVYVMTLDEAVQAVKKIEPSLVIPMHYGSIVGDKDMGEKFIHKMREEVPYVKAET